MTLLGDASVTGLVGGIPNLLWLEPLITQRLASALPEGTWMGDVASLSDASGRRLQAPGCLTLFSGAVPDEQDLYGRDVEFRQRWTPVAVSRAPTEIKAAADARAEAGALLSSIMDAMLGWQPNGVDSPFKLYAFPAPVYAGSYLLTPITFEVSITFAYNSFEEQE